MTSTVMMDRTGMMSGTTGLSATGTTPMAPNMMMVPRCTLKLEKVQNGMKLTCTCDDAVACSMLQNLCTMLQGGMVSLCTMMNGMVMCTCNLTMGLCKCEMTQKGCTITCTSGDTKCCEMIQACCDCVDRLTKAGCTCCVTMNNTPVCCGC